MENNNFNLNDMMKMLSTMDKDQLEKGLSQASKILNSSDADKIIRQIKNNEKRQ